MSLAPDAPPLRPHAAGLEGQLAGAVVDDQDILAPVAVLTGDDPAQIDAVHLAGDGLADQPAQVGK